MFKKALKVAAAFTLLLAGYAGYVRVFAVMASRLRPDRPIVGIVVDSGDSRTKREAIELARTSFGPGHWSAERDLAIRFYNAERGYWMYARNYERLADGKRLRFQPFALIWKSRQGKAVKTATSDVAAITLDQPLGLVTKPGDESLHVVSAKLEGDVRLRDDKGTADRADDLSIGPMTYLEYDEPSLQIRSKSAVVMRDRDMKVDGEGLLILLRPREPGLPDGKASGFNGAQTIFLHRDVHIVLSDVGRSGVVPGGTPPAGGKAASGPTPLDLRNDGEMQIDLPRPRLPVRVGPPTPPGPTIVQFSTNVRVVEGRPGQAPNQLNCDHLRLTLLPGDKPKPRRGAEDKRPGPSGGAEGPAEPAEGAATAEEAAAEEAAADAGEGSLNGLALRRAEATGHAVWLRSEAQGVKARCNELIHQVLMPDAPNKTYLRADSTPKASGEPTPKLWIEKIDVAREGPDAGKVTGVTTIRTVDATIFDDGNGGDPATVGARGPGLLEVQPARDKPVERSAEWQDELWLETVAGRDGRPRKKITLTGDPRFSDVKATLTSHRIIVVTLKPKDDADAQGAPAGRKPGTKAATATATGAAAGAGAATGSGAFEVETLVAREDVRLDSPGRTMTARDRLDVEFEPAPQAAAVAATNPAPAAPEPQPAGAAPAPAQVAQKEPAPAGEEPPAQPKVDVRANRIWAKILLRPAADPAVGRASASAAPTAPARGDKGDVQEVRLRGAVRFHQDPPAGKERGILVTGEALDLLNQGGGKSKFKVFQRDPTAAPKPGDGAALGEAVVPLAHVETEEFNVDGPIIGLDQSADLAWVDGRGQLTQLAERGLLTDKGLGQGDAEPGEGGARGGRAARPAAAGADRGKAKAGRIPMTIRWTKEMLFTGRAVGPGGRTVGRAEFLGGESQDRVRAEMEDAMLVCQKLTTYMDRTVSLAQPPRAPKPARGGAGGDAEPEPGADGPEAEPEPKAQIAFIECESEVVVISRKVDRTIDPLAPVLIQQQRIEGEYLTYEKATGNFRVPSAGRVFLYDREDPNEAGKTAPGPGSPRRTVTPAAGPPRSASPRARTAVLGRNSAPGDTLRGDRGPGQAGARGKKGPSPLKLTQVQFRKEMLGRFGSAKQGEAPERRWADFFGDVEVHHAKVASEQVALDPDKLPPDFLRLTAETLRVVSDPMPAGSSTPNRNFLTAWERAQATTADTTIQADKITYDSLKELFYAYGEDGREVNIIQQSSIGQPFSGGQGTAVMYNRKTGESQVFNPQSFTLYDPKTGGRPQPATVPEEKKKPRRGNQLRITPRNNFERKGFSGH